MNKRHEEYIKTGRIELGVGKYQTCVVPDCAEYAITEFYAVNAKGDMVCLGSCDAHIKEVRVLAQTSAMGKHPKLAEEHLFVCKAQDETKTKKGSASPSKAVDPRQLEHPVVSSSTKAPPILRALSGWEWAAGKGEWRNVHGNVVEIFSLSTAELTSAAVAIAEANYQRFRENIAWVRLLPLTDIYSYPQEKLAVGKYKAGLKLDEFMVECHKRGLSPKPSKKKK